MPGLGDEYDGDAPTGAMDFAMFQRVRQEYNDSGTTYYGRNIPRNNALKVKRNKSQCAIAMPNNLSAGYSISYTEADPGIVGIAAIDAINSTGGAASMGEGLSAANDMANKLAAAAGGALPEAELKLAVDAVNAINGFIGTDGNLSKNQMLQLAKGKVLNPFTEQLFNKVAFRNHNFKFKFVSRSENEAKVVKRIIEYFKAGAHPILQGAAASGGGGNTGVAQASQFRFIQVPDLFDIKLMRVSIDGGSYENSTLDDGTDELHFKYKRCYCKAVQVNYTPDGQYNAFRNYDDKGMNVPAVELNLQFVETALLNQADIINGF